jgi:hypothetical protein
MGAGISSSQSGIDPFGKSKRSEYKQSTDIRNKAVSAARPEHTIAFAQMLYPELMKLGEFDRRRSADAAGMGERRMLDANASNMAGRNLTGSGADYYLQQGIRGGRQAQLNEANNRAQETATRQSWEGAMQNQAMTLQALLGVPIVGKPAPGYMQFLGSQPFGSLGAGGVSNSANVSV